MADTRRRSHATASQGPDPDPDPDGHVNREGNACDRNGRQLKTNCVCNHCGEHVGYLYNSFYKLAGSPYYMPTLLGSGNSTLKTITQAEGHPGVENTDLADCIVYDSHCPGCNTTLAVQVIQVPPEKRAFRGRLLFNLDHITLQCKTGSDTSVVEPYIDPTFQPLALDPSNSPASVPASASIIISSSSPSPDAMDKDTRSSIPRHESHFREPHHQPLQQVEANRQSLPPPLRSPGVSTPFHAITQKSSSNPHPSQSPAVRPVHDVNYAQPSPREGTAGLTNRTRDLPPPVAHSPVEHHRSNGHYHPPSPRSSHEVSLDAFERLQTQVSEYTCHLHVRIREIQDRDREIQIARDREIQGLRELTQKQGQQLHHHANEIVRANEAISGFQYEMQNFRDGIEKLGQDVHILLTSQPVPRGTNGSAQLPALELMANELGVVSKKASEVADLKIAIELMKTRLSQLEKTTIPPPQPSPPSAHTVHSYQSALPHPHTSTPVQTLSRPASFQHYGSHSAVQDEPERSESVPAHSGWATVNQSTKRPHPNAIDNSHIEQSVASPKRTKLAPIEPRAYDSPKIHDQHVYEHMDTGDSDLRMSSQTHTHSHTLPPQQPRESLELSIPQTPLASQHVQHPGYSYNAQEGPSNTSWVTEAHQRIFEQQRPTRGRGRGGRGGRPRKSMPVTHVIEIEDPHVVANYPAAYENFYDNNGRSGHNIVRRGSGGGGRGRPSSNDRAVSLGMQGVSPGLGMGIPLDPHSHTKKTRTKPTRNEQGVLIRKDGRPDMRSQSSAANLRKVHQRKEEQRGEDKGESETPSPTFQTPNVTASVQKKHTEIMGKMFPKGVDKSREEHDYARKVFEEGQSHTAQPRGQHHHSHVQTTEHKQELRDERMGSQSPDVDMARAEYEGDEDSNDGELEPTPESGGHPEQSPTPKELKIARSSVESETAPFPQSS